MLYTLKLEAIGDGIAYDRRMHRRHGVPWRPRSRLEAAVGIPWVARITGLSDRHGFQREFIQGRRDYLDANGTGNRGVWIYYLLEDGLYEVNELTSWQDSRRYCLRVANGQAETLTLREAVQCLS